MIRKRRDKGSALLGHEQPANVRVKMIQTLVQGKRYHLVTAASLCTLKLEATVISGIIITLNSHYGPAENKVKGSPCAHERKARIGES